MSWVRNPLAAPKFSHTLDCGPTLPRISQASSSAATSAASLRIFAGTSGWAYPTWKPDFYPAGTPAKRFLEFYASQLTSVEVNYTFRALPTAKMLEGWLACDAGELPVQLQGAAAHHALQALGDCSDDVAQFIAALEPVRQAGKLGLLLFQLPPNFKADTERLPPSLPSCAFRRR